MRIWKHAHDKKSTKIMIYTLTDITRDSWRCS